MRSPWTGSGRHGFAALDDLPTFDAHITWTGTAVSGYFTPRLQHDTLEPNYEANHHFAIRLNPAQLRANPEGLATSVVSRIVAELRVHLRKHGYDVGPVKKRSR